VHQGFVAGYAQSIQTVFLVAVPIAALAFLATWLIPQVELKQWPEAGSGGPGADTAVAAAVAREALPGDARQALPGDARQVAPQPSVTQEALDPQDASRTDP
jgi:hypothetical protein